MIVGQYVLGIKVESEQFGYLYDSETRNVPSEGVKSRRGVTVEKERAVETRGFDDGARSICIQTRVFLLTSPWLTVDSVVASSMKKRFSGDRPNFSARRKREERDRGRGGGTCSFPQSSRRLRDYALGETHA